MVGTGAPCRKHNQIGFPGSEEANILLTLNHIPSKSCVPNASPHVLKFSNSKTRHICRNKEVLKKKKKAVGYSVITSMQMGTIEPAISWLKKNTEIG